MANDQSLKVNLLGDATGLNQALNKADAQLKQFGKRAKDIGKTLTTRLTLPIGAAGFAAIKMASDVEESLNKVDVAFGESSKEVKDFAKNTLESFGIAEGSALDMAALFGDMSTAMGISRSDAADLSTSLVGLAGDLASFKNINIEEVTTALSGVFTGETESLKRLGVVMTETNLKQFALSQGITKNLKDFSQSEKVLLRYQFVMNATSNAHGDFARTSEGSANQMRIFTESLKQLGASFGAVVLPAFTKLVKKANEVVKRFQAFDQSTKKVIALTAAIAAAAGPMLYLAGSVIPKVVGGIRMIGVAVQFASGPVGIIIAGISVLTLGLQKLVNSKGFQLSAWQTFKNAVLSGGNAIRFVRLATEDNAKNISQSQEDIQSSVQDTTKAFQDQFDAMMKIMGGDYQMDDKTGGKKATVIPLPSIDDLAVEELYSDAQEISQNLDDIIGTDKQLIFAIATDEASVENFNNTLSETAAKVAAIQENITETGEVMTESLIDNLEPLEQSFLKIGESMVSAMFQAGNAFQNMGKALMGIAKQIIKQLISAILKAVILRALLGGAAGGAGLSGIAGIMKMAVGSLGETGFKFADGGIVSGPTMGLVGEYAGARSNPEVIAPLDKLKNMLPQGGGGNVNVSGEFVVRGQDLVVALERANRNRNKFL
jgi:hypothetical protein